MKNNLFLRSPQFAITLLMAAVAALSLSPLGCGGGGGGGGGGNGGGGGGGCARNVPAGNPSLATITGTVNDTSGAPVDNVPITILVPGGPNISTSTDCTGKFVATNVPLTATAFTATSPNVLQYYNYGNYNGKEYDLINCTLPLPKLTAGQNAPFTAVAIYLGGLNPPPQPPAGGCPM